ncbi:MAG: hypothetical protein ACOC44_09040 [Promethearchaeia archaeon]
MLKKEFALFDSHLHTTGNFLPPDMNLIEYLDKFNVKKAGKGFD